MASTTLELAKFTEELSYEDIPKVVIDIVKKSIIDVMGCVVFGSTTPWGRKVIDMVREWGGKEESTVWGLDLKVPCAHAALANGTSGHAFEMEDLLLGAHYASIVPTSAFGAAERQGDIDGKTYLTAVVVGYETPARISSAWNHKELNTKLYASSMYGPFGAAAAVGRILGLDTEAIARSFHLAGTQSGGLYNLYYPTKRFNIGRAAQSGVMSALLAEKGFTAMTDILESEWNGFCMSYSDHYELHKITEGLGKFYNLENISHKMYSCGRGATCVVGALKELVTENPEVTADQIDKVNIYLSEEIYQGYMPWWHTVDNIAQSITSMPYCSAVMLIEGDALIDQFTEEKIRDPKILALAKKVEVKPKNELSGYQVAVEVFLKNGNRFYHKVLHPKGSPGNPMTLDEIEGKFRRVASRVLNANKVENLISNVRNLERLNDVSVLAEDLIP